MIKSRKSVLYTVIAVLLDDFSHSFSMTPLPAKFSRRRRHFSTARPHISRVSSLVTQVDRSLPRVARYNIRVLESWKPVGIIEFIRLVFIILPSSLDCRVVPWHFGLQRRSTFRYFLLFFLPSAFRRNLLGSFLVPFAVHSIYHRRVYVSSRMESQSQFVRSFRYGGGMDGWMDGRPRKDVEEYVEGWNVVAKFFHYDVSWGGGRGYWR